MENSGIDLSRRQFVASCLKLGAALPLFMGPAQLAFANVPTNKRLVVVFLRGGMDSLHAVVPYADENYQAIRGGLALDTNKDDLIAADPFFAFHKNLKGLAGLYKKGELAVVHAVATPYRRRSHFDAQDLLENGSTSPSKLKTGWLNRAIESMGKPRDSLGLSVGASTQLLMRGEAKVASWSPSVLKQASDDTLYRLAQIYESDPLLGDGLLTATQNADIAAAIRGNAGKGGERFIKMMEATAQFLMRPTGPRIATLDFGGFDTHSKQAPRLSQLLKGLDEGVQTYRNETTDDVWKDTVIYIVSEFGRTVKPNGSNGTDHGTAGLAFVAGGGVRGGRIITQWPGLSESKLYGGRDLNPTTDLRCVSKQILTAHYDISEDVIDRYILPQTRDLRPIELF